MAELVGGALDQFSGNAGS